jgi:uncharacterized protein
MSLPRRDRHSRSRITTSGRRSGSFAKTSDELVNIVSSKVSALRRPVNERQNISDKGTIRDRELDGEGWISLLYTSVPPSLRGRGIANELARMALEYAREHQLKVDVVCPIVFHYTTKHPEYKPLMGIRGYR